MNMQIDSYTKPHASASERVQHLKAKGLIVYHPKVAARKIEEIGYERLRIYFLSRREKGTPGKPFFQNVTYRDILRLYECDAKLRNMCFSEVGRFELVFRNRLSETLSAKFGGHPYSELTAFKSADERNKRMHKLLDVFNASKDMRAKHYRDTYASPTLPPIWVMKELLTFGDAARLYEALRPGIREQIAADFKVPNVEIFDSWVKCFVDLRNICAHHDRLFNRNFQKRPQRFKKENVPSVGTDTAKLKALVECLDFVLENKAKKKLRAGVEKVIKQYVEVNDSEVGF